MRLQFKTEYDIEWLPNTMDIKSIIGYVTLAGIRIFSCRLPEKFLDYEDPKLDEAIREYMGQEFAVELSEVLSH